ncbi:MAG: c-type cytochrome [Alphaproteobacteria bacterium]
MRSLLRRGLLIAAIMALSVIPGSGVTVLGSEEEELLFPGGPDIAWPPIDSANGRVLFATKGCVLCHSVNGVGGLVGPSFDAARMPPFANPFDLAARMFRGAEAMIELQKRNLGYQIELTGQELADIIGFIHDEEEQLRFSEDDIPPWMQELMPYRRL